MKLQRDQNMFALVFPVTNRLSMGYDFERNMALFMQIPFMSEMYVPQYLLIFSLI